MIADATGKIVAANKAVEKYIGYTPQELIGNNFFDQDFFKKKTKTALINKMKKRLDGNFIPAYEIKVQVKSGAFKFLEISGNKIKYDGQVCDLIIFHDVTDRSNNHRRLLQELCNSEEKFCGITNLIRDAIIMVDEQAKVTYWNPAAEKIFGYTKNEATGKFVHDLVVPATLCREGKERIDLAVKVFGQTGVGYFTVGNVEVVGVRKNGTEFPAELSISPTKVGDKWHALGVVKDISERKKEEQKIRDAEQRYHALFNQAPLGIVIVDLQTLGFVEFNDVAASQLGYTRDEFEKLTIYDITADNNESVTSARIANVAKNGGGEYETVHRTKNGETRNVLISTLTLQLAQKTFLHAVLRDITEMRKTQNALVKSEARYRQLVELAQEGIWAIDNDFKTTFVNPRMAQMLGYSQSEMIGRNLVDFLYEDSAEKLIKFVQKFDRPNVRGHYEYEFPSKDGAYVNTSLAISTITDNYGQVIGKFALASDITERTRWENELKASEERFRAISTSAMDAIILVDGDYNVMYWNPAAEVTFGYSEEEALGKKLYDLVVPSRKRTEPWLIFQEMTQKPSFMKHFEFDAMRKDGTSFPIETSVTLLELNDKKCMLTIARDVSERKMMEDALKQERDMLENMASSMDAGLALISQDFRVLWANPLLRKFSDSQKNAYCYALYDQSDRVCPGCGVKKIFETGVAVDRHDYNRKTPEGDEWVELIVTPVKDKDGKVVAALELAVNITERKRLQKKLAEYSQRLEELIHYRTQQLKQTQAELVKSERLAAIGELAGMVGHDLRNPLTGIKNSTYFLKKKGQSIPPEQAKEMIEIIDKCVDYSNKIVNDLLDYSREIRLDLEECSLRQILLEALSMVQIPETVKIENNVRQKQTFKADSDKIKRVFVNLIQNAVDAMPNGGKLTIESRMKDNLEISFQDTGTGISDEVLPKLFSPLFTTKAKGMGFGLAICKRIVDAHQGTISVKTLKNQGTNITVTLSIAPKIEVGGDKIWLNVQESSLSTMTKT